MDLTIFYTAHIAGDLALLPRLFTFLQQLKSRYDPPALLLDLGDSCEEGIWHCAATGGRSTLVVLDGMGFHAANIEGILTPQGREKLQPTVTMGLVDSQHNWRYNVPPMRDEGIVIATQPSPALTLCILAQAGLQTKLENRILSPQDVKKGQVGILQVALESEEIVAQAIHDMPSGLKPDATIAASVEFVEDEARYYRMRDQPD